MTRPSEKQSLTLPTARETNSSEECSCYRQTMFRRRAVTSATSTLQRHSCHPHPHYATHGLLAIIALVPRLDAPDALDHSERSVAYGLGGASFSETLPGHRVRYQMGAQFKPHSCRSHILSYLRRPRAECDTPSCRSPGMTNFDRPYAL